MLDQTTLSVPKSSMKGDTSCIIREGHDTATPQSPKEPLLLYGHCWAIPKPTSWASTKPPRWTHPTGRNPTWLLISWRFLPHRALYPAWDKRGMGQVVPRTCLWKPGQGEALDFPPKKNGVSCRIAISSASTAVCVGSVRPQPKIFYAIGSHPQGIVCEICLPIYGFHQECWLLKWYFWEQGTYSKLTGHSSPKVLTFLHSNVHGAGGGTLQQLLVGLGWLVEELHEQSAGLLVLAAPDGGELIQLLLHEASVIQRVLQAIPKQQESRLEKDLNCRDSLTHNTSLFLSGTGCFPSLTVGPDLKDLLQPKQFCDSLQQRLKSLLFVMMQSYTDQCNLIIIAAVNQKNSSGSGGKAIRTWDEKALLTSSTLMQVFEQNVRHQKQGPCLLVFV